jgi:ATP-dependent RNA helicase DeaD
MVVYRIAVGREQGATPKDIVGAIANEANIDSKFIGQINLFDDYSTVELPDGMPSDLFNLLKKVRVKRVPLDIELFSSAAAPVRSPRRESARPGRPAGDKPLKKKRD